MKPFFGEEWICGGCHYEGEPDTSFDTVWDNPDGVRQILHICPICGRAEIVGESLHGDELYF